MVLILFLEPSETIQQQKNMTECTGSRLPSVNSHDGSAKTRDLMIMPVLEQSFIMSSRGNSTGDYYCPKFYTGDIGYDWARNVSMSQRIKTRATPTERS